MHSAFQFGQGPTGLSQERVSLVLRMCLPLLLEGRRISKIELEIQCNERKMKIWCCASDMHSLIDTAGAAPCLTYFCIDLDVNVLWLELHGNEAHS